MLQAARQTVDGSATSQAGFGSPVESTAVASPTLAAERTSLPGSTPLALAGSLKISRPDSLKAVCSWLAGCASPAGAVPPTRSSGGRPTRPSLSCFASSMGAVPTSGSSRGRPPCPSRLAFGSLMGTTSEARTPSRHPASAHNVACLPLGFTL